MDEQIFKNLQDGLAEAIKISQGKSRPAGVYFVLTPADIKAIRKGVSMSQSVFAQTFELSLDTIKGWEQGKRSPDAGSTNYLRMIKADPAGVLRALNAA